jgi:hypothetical protein
MEIKSFFDEMSDLNGNEGSRAYGNNLTLQVETW